MAAHVATERPFRAEPRVPLPTVSGTALSWRAGPGILGTCGPPWAPLAERILEHPLQLRCRKAGKIVGELNGQHAKLKGEFVWHHHENDWDYLVWIPYNTRYEIEEAWPRARASTFLFCSVVSGTPHRRVFKP